MSALIAVNLDVIRRGFLFACHRNVLMRPDVGSVRSPGRPRAAHFPTKHRSNRCNTYSVLTQSRLRF
jgi:hypothetical protein